MQTMNLTYRVTCQQSEAAHTAAAAAAALESFFFFFSSLLQADCSMLVIALAQCKPEVMCLKAAKKLFWGSCQNHPGNIPQ